MKNKNKFIALLILATMGLVACGGNPSNETPASSSATPISSSSTPSSSNSSASSASSSSSSSASQSSTSSSSSSSSSSNSSSQRNPDVEAIYNIYVTNATNAGLNPLSYEEWLASFLGPNGLSNNPVISVNADGYWTIDGVSTGVLATSSEGIRGQDNTYLFTGEGTPNSNKGNAGDSYVNTQNWDYYVKDASGWQLKGNLVGEIGHENNALKHGIGTPDPLLGEVGDVYVNTSNWDYYVKTAAGWEYKGNLKTGPQVKYSVTIALSEHGYVSSSVTTAPVGDPVTLTAHPDDNYHLSELLVNDVSVFNAVSNNTYTTQMVENGLTVQATFSEDEVVHVHEYKTTYDYDENGHWRECVAGDARIDEGPHRFGDWITDENPSEINTGHKYRQCEVCDYKEEETIPVLEHTHRAINWSYNDTTHYYVCLGCGEHYDIEAHNFEETAHVDPTSTQDGYVTETCSICGYVRTTTLPREQQDIRIYATNDIHGQIYQETSGSDVTRCGIDKYMTFLKEMKNEGNALLLDQGDTWQGSIYSNYNRGGLITDLMNYVQFNARTVGNHDFDWGLNALVNNSSKSYNGYKTPTLAANVYDYNYNTKTEGNVQQSQIGVPSVTYTIGGVKVGIVGTIGSDQITSICTNHVKDICFKAHIPVIKAEAQRLRSQENCDIVILSHHGDQDDLRNNSLDQFIDVALCAHSHQYESMTEGSLVYVQGGSYNQYIYELNLPYSISSGSLGEITYGAIGASTIDEYVVNIDSTIASMVSANYTSCAAQEPLNEVLANDVVGTFYSSSSAANLMADAIYEQAKSEGYDIYCSFVNTARHDLSSGQWTYADVFEAFPFDNEVYIMDVTGADMVNEIGRYNNNRKDTSKWPSNNEFDIYDTQTKYRIAVIDYLGVHNNSSREYDYFPSSNGQVVATLSKNYRPILIDYLKRHNYNNNETLYYSNFATSRAEFVRNGCAVPKNITLSFVLNYPGEANTLYYLYTYQQGFYYDYAYPSEPQRDGYRFTGWYFDAACTEPVYGIATADKTLYAGWEEAVASEYYTAKLQKSTVAGSGEQTLYLSATNGVSSVTVTVEMENGYQNSSYDEFGLGALTGMLVTMPSGYKMTGYNFSLYKYPNIALYSNADKTTQYDLPASTTSGNELLYSAVNLNYSSLYFYNTYNGNCWFYYAEFILQAI